MKEMREALEKRFEIKTAVIGTGRGEQSEGRILNKIVRVTDEGWEYEPDQRHADMIVNSLGLQDAKPVDSPGEDEKKHEEEENKVELDKERATAFRSISARVNYLAADRPDLMYASKEICRAMSRPTLGS